MDNLKCNIESIEAACGTGCVHCFNKSIKYNTEYKNGCDNTIPFLRKALLIASSKGHLEICKKLVKMGAEPTKQVFIAVARSGHKDLFIWLHEIGCPWSYEVYDTAMTYGHKSIAEYALEHGCGA
jgi:ankyrin repeat protein